MRSACLVLLLSLAVAAQTPDTRGNHPSNDGPVKASAPGGSKMAGSLWRVVCPQLNGRRDPSLKSPVVRVFRQGTVLQADVGRGGSDEVLLNAKDDQGRTWMRVRSREGKDLDCYVRAAAGCIRPVTR